jgi:hypothetical protein
MPALHEAGSYPTIFGIDRWLLVRATVVAPGRLGRSKGNSPPSGGLVHDRDAERATRTVKT